MTFHPISYVYAPTVPRSKNTKSGQKIAKNLNTARTNQHIQPGATVLDTERPPVAEDGDENRYDQSKAEAETATANSDDDNASFPPIEDILSRALQKRDLGAVTEHCSMANAGRGEGEVAFPSQRDKAICNNTSTPDDLIVVDDDSNLFETVESDFWSGNAGIGSGETEDCLLSPATIPGPRDSATPCLDLDPAEFGSLAAVPVLGVLDENEPLAVISNSQSDILDEKTQRRPDMRGEGDGGSSNASPYEGDGAALLVAESLMDTLSDSEDESAIVVAIDQSPCLNPGKPFGYIKTDSDDEFDIQDAGSNGSTKMPRSAKRKQSPSHATGPVQKRNHRFQTSTSCSRPRLDGVRRYDRSVISHNGHSTGNIEHDTKGRLPSPVPSIAHTTDTEMSSSRSDLDQPLKGGLPALTEITFRPRSPRSCAFTAVVRDGCDGNGVSLAQLAQLIKGIGYTGEPDIFTIKPLREESLLLTGVCHYPASQLLPCCPSTLPRYANGNTPSNNTTRARLVRGRPGRTGTEARSPAAISDDDSLSDSDYGNLRNNTGSGNDGYCSEDEQDGPSPRKNVPWDELDEERLRVYKEEGKPWKWIFDKFPGRTGPAIRTRWTIIQQRAE